MTLFERDEGAKRKRLEEICSQTVGAFKEGALDTVMQFASEGLTLTNNPERAAYFNRILAETCLKKNDCEEALEYALKSLSAAQASGSRSAICTAAVCLGKIYAVTGRYVQADDIWEYALSLANKLHDNRKAGRIMLDLAINDHRRGDCNKARRTIELAYQMLEQNKDIRGMTTCLGRLVALCLESNDIESARQVVRKLEQLARDNEDSVLEALVAFRQGTLFMKERDFDASLNAFDKSLKIYQKQGDLKNQAMAGCEVCRAHLRLGNFKEASGVLGMIATIAGNPLIMNEVQLVMAELAAFKEDYTTAIGHYHEALEVAESIGNPDRFRGFHQSIYDTLIEGKLPIADARPLLKKALTGYRTMGLEKEEKELHKLLAG